MLDNYVIGIDEAGRGPLAGPVTIGLVGLPYNLQAELSQTFFSAGIRDSKKLSPKKRMAIFEQLALKHKMGDLMINHIHIEASVIDKQGLSYAIKSAIYRALKPFTLQAEAVNVKLDGGLRAPKIFLKQESIIRGDEQEVAIALASVVAKVLRDKLMIKADDKFPNYGFVKHKGYGTKAHIEAIKKYGPCPIHRLSFLTKIKIDKH